MIINVGKTIFKITISCRREGEKILSSTVFNTEKIKDTLRLAVKDIVISGEKSVARWVINLGIIPAAQFDMLFIPRLAQAFAERLSCEQASIAEQQLVTMATSIATKSSVLPGEFPPDGEGLSQLAHYCLKPEIFKTLLKDCPAYQLHQLLKLLLEGAGQSPKMVPPFWYGRVTDARLSIAALLYLIKNRGKDDWLEYQHSPLVKQVADWTKAIVQGEIPPEQVMQLLTGNSSFDSLSSGQPAYPALIVMRWLLPLWRQPAVRKVIHRRIGRKGVHRLDAYLSRCLQCQDYCMQEVKGMPSVSWQAELPQDDTVLSPDGGMSSDALQITLSRDNAILPECGGIPAASQHTMQPGKGGIRTQVEPRLSSQGINNAGLLLLWPLLPQLFSQLGLWAEAEFVNDAARWQAVYALDQLVWGEVNTTEERLTLNQMLCGVSCSASVPPTTPLSLLQLQQTDDWLTAIGQQLPGWQKLSSTDIRQLFLQRAGEISTEGPVPQISVWPEPWDFLLRDWPWPMTVASFPWTEQPLTIVWPLNGFTG